MTDMQFRCWRVMAQLLAVLVVLQMGVSVHASPTRAEDEYMYEGALTGTWTSADGLVVAALCHDLHDVWPADVNRTVEWLFVQHSDGMDGAAWVWRDTSAHGAGAVERVQGSTWSVDGPLATGPLDVDAVDVGAGTLQLNGVALTRTNASTPASCPASGRASVPVPTRGRKWRMSGAFGDNVRVNLCRTVFTEKPYDVRGWATNAGGDSFFFFAQTFGARALGEYVHYTPTGVAAHGTLELVYDAWASTAWTAYTDDGAAPRTLTAVLDADAVPPSPVECHDLLALDGVAHHGRFGVDEGEQLSLVRVPVTWSGFFFNPLWSRLHAAAEGEPLRVDAVEMAIGTEPRPLATTWQPDTTPWTAVAVDVPEDDVWFASLRATTTTTVHTAPGVDLLAPQTYYAAVRVPHGSGVGEFPLTASFATVCSVQRCSGSECACAQSPNGTCTRCPWGFECGNGACFCEGQCDGKQCGADGCGALCGTCGEGTYCTVDQQCAPVTYVGTWQAYMYTGEAAQLHVCEDSAGGVTGMLSGDAWPDAAARPFFIGLDEPFTRNAGTAWWMDPNATGDTLAGDDTFAYSMRLTNEGTIEFTAESTATEGAPTGARTAWLAERVSSDVPASEACVSPHAVAAADFSGEFLGAHGAAFPHDEEPVFVCMWGRAIRARLSTGFFQGACTAGASGAGSASCRGHWYRGAAVGDFVLALTQPTGLGTWSGWTCAGLGCAAARLHAGGGGDTWAAHRVAAARPDRELCVDPRADDEHIMGVWELVWSSGMLVMNPPPEVTLCPGVHSDVFGQFTTPSLHLFGDYYGHTLDALLLHDVMPVPPTVELVPFEIAHDVAAGTFDGVWRSSSGGGEGRVTGSRSDDPDRGHPGCVLADEVEPFAGVWEDMDMQALRACQRNGQVAATLGASTVYIGHAAMWGARGVWRSSTGWGLFEWELTNPGERAQTTLLVREWDGADRTTTRTATYMMLHNATEAVCTAHLGAAERVEGEWAFTFGDGSEEETVHVCQEFGRMRAGWPRGWLEGTVENGVAHGVWANEQASGSFVLAFTANGQEAAGTLVELVGARAGTAAGTVALSGTRQATARPVRDACVVDVHAGVVYDGLFGSNDVDQAFQTSGDEVSVSWAFFFSKRGDVTLEWAAGTTAGASDVVPWTSVASGLSHARRAGLHVADGTTVFASVRATDSDGHTATASSDGVLVRSRLSVQIPHTGEVVRTGLVDVSGGDAFLATVRVPAGLSNGFTHVEFGALDAGDRDPHGDTLLDVFGHAWNWHSVGGVTLVLDTSGGTGASAEWTGGVGLTLDYGGDFDASNVQIEQARVFRWDGAAGAWVDATPDAAVSVRACASSLSVDVVAHTVEARVCAAGQYALFAPDKGPPLKPRDLTATPGTHKVALTWGNPHTGGLAIASYTLQVSTSGADAGAGAVFGDTQTAIPYADSPVFDVLHLVADHDYTFRVAARNSAGLGSWAYVTTRTHAAASPSPSPGAGGVGGTLGKAFGAVAAVAVVVLLAVWWRRRRRPAWEKRGVFGRGGRRRDMMSDEEGAAFIAYAGAVPPEDDSALYDEDGDDDGLEEEERALGMRSGDLGDVGGDGIQLSRLD